MAQTQGKDDDRGSDTADAGMSRNAYIVDDDKAVRQSLTVLLSAHGWKARAFDDARHFIGEARDLEAGLLLLDLNMPGTTGLDLLESHVDDLDRFAVVVISGEREIAKAVRSIRAGAIDFIEKPFRSAALIERIEALHGQLEQHVQSSARKMRAQARIDSLTPREREVLERLLSGASNKMVARALDLSPRTVEMHRARILQRLDVQTSGEALHLAREAGMDAVPV